MRSLLTTGQMLDNLEVGQIAERIFEPSGDCSDAYTKAKLDADGDLMFYVKHWKEWSRESLTGSVIGSNWTISTDALQTHKTQQKGG
ncbi:MULTISPECIES: hypothetical protein [unclassified Sporosarcina]|uniref:hypothetical protein n=1 Tax=unclassified Sporosarcina TaxID=2647733 RepID=UPI001A919631|nr:MULTISPECIES: hypothetical protein [unclassified Sporosarcina]MBO0588201.1 hypothetical protein [Sporosarcina sp. E16_8]MBO0601955.1 hypothetical protein [Sporosarcina sp. E16_3]